MGIIYTLFLIGAAIYSTFTPDFSYELLMQRDSTNVVSVVSIFADDNVVKMEDVGETLSIDDFNNNYDICGISTNLPNRSQVSFYIYIACAICCLLFVVQVIRRYRQR